MVEKEEEKNDVGAYLDDSLEKVLILFNNIHLDDAVKEMVHHLDACSYIKGMINFEPLDRPTGPPPKSSIEEAPKLELKPLPSHLYHAYLGANETLSIVLSSELSVLQKGKLLHVLREHKRAIGWTMADIRGISPGFCMHKILMKDGHKPSVEYQRHLNPVMKEVVRKEVIKWLDVIIPISDSKWILIAPEYQEKTNFTCPYGTYAFKRMLFGLCNAPATVSKYLSKVLARYEETNLVQNLDKCHFMVREGIVLGHKVSKDRLEVDKAKVDAIDKLPPPISIKGVRSFVGLIEKDMTFKVDEHFLKAYEDLINILVTAPIITALDWWSLLS
nr:uncharacterized protein LOC104088309 [Nicotiana tomentosiformis]